ncbi:MAG: sulfatase-like hydrolase/transferase [Kiritimatiellia bacterium]
MRITRSHLPDESEPNYRTWVKEKGCSREFARDWAAEFGSNPPGGPEETQLFTSASMCAQVSELSADQTMEAYTTQHTIDFLRESVADQQPFFCWASLYRPHQPYTPVKEYFDRFDTGHWGRGARYGDGIAEPPSFTQPKNELPPKLETMRSGTHIPWQYMQAQEDPGIMRRAMAAYFACVLEIDDCIGRMLRELDTLGLSENTIVIYASDHGDFVGSHGLIEKVAPGHNVYEETLRVPWMVRWPGHVREGQVSNDLVELVDLYPTLLDLCGLKAPDGPYPLQGRSLAPHLTRGIPVGRSFIVSENWSQAAIITEQMKLGHWLPCPHDPKRDHRHFGDQLFDRAHDPHELHNLINDPQWSETRQELLDAFDSWRREVPDTGKRASANAMEAKRS